MRNILFTRHFDEKIEEDVNVILSPQYYWIKKIEIPIQSLKEAKKVAYSILKLNEKEFYFDAIQIDEEFYAIAIRKDLDVKIDKKYIKSLRITQCEFRDVECLNLPNNFSLQKVDGLFFCFPSHKEDCICVGNLLEKLQLSNYTFNIFETINLSKKDLYFIFISFALFIFIFIGKFISYSIVNNDLSNKYNNLKKYNLPMTSFQLDSMIDNYKQKIEYQQRLRKKIKILQKIHLVDNEYIKHFSYKDGILNLIIYSNRNFDSIFKGMKFKSKKRKNIYEVNIYVK